MHQKNTANAVFFDAMRHKLIIHFIISFLIIKFFNIQKRRSTERRFRYLITIILRLF